MKPFFLFLLCCLAASLKGQNVTVDANSFSPQELIEDILIDSDCITDVVVTNTIGGDFGSMDLSYGYFTANDSGFPLDEGVVLTTGRLSNVPGPNDNLSDDDAPGWIGDADLEFVLNEQNTTNATIVEFDFTAVAEAIRFRYLFASEEYQEGDPNTCRFSDLFGFLIRPIDDQRYTNIALVPDTQTPVKVTTVHPGIEGGCDAINEAYFGAFNPNASPINFNGQTRVLTATTTVTPGERYHVKLVIADEKNHRFDSAVFLEAGSFGLQTDIGGDRLIAAGTALCENETAILDATTDQAERYDWYKDGALLSTATESILEVAEAGFYQVEITLENSCQSFGEARIEYDTAPAVQDVVLSSCDTDSDGLTIFNLFHAEAEIVFGDQTNEIQHFYTDADDALQDINPIPNPRNYRNSVVSEIVYARVVNRNNCISIAALTLEVASIALDIGLQTFCDEDNDGRTSIDLDAITVSFLDQIQLTAPVRYFRSAEDALSGENVLPNPYENQTPFFETLFFTIEDELQCYTLDSVDLQILAAPNLPDDATITYCTNLDPNGILLDSGASPDPLSYAYSWRKNGVLLDEVSSSIRAAEPGSYTVRVTAQNGCSSERRFDLSVSGLASEIVITQDPGNSSTINVEAMGPGSYTFALDRPLAYTTNTQFTDISPGVHTLFVKDANGCGVQLKAFSILGMPAYFTPNDDGIHDVFRIAGQTKDTPKVLSFQVFDRFGKLLYAENGTRHQGWNGTSNGTPLPTGNYWYVMQLEDAIVYKGHVALIRR